MRHIELKFNKQLMAVYWGVPKPCSKSKLMPHLKQSTRTCTNITLPYLWKPQAMKNLQLTLGAIKDSPKHVIAQPAHIPPLCLVLPWSAQHPAWSCLVWLLRPVICLLWWARRLQIWLL